MNESTTLAFVLKTMPYKEKDRLVYAYTKEFGRLTFIAKGVKKWIVRMQRLYKS